MSMLLPFEVKDRNTGRSFGTVKCLDEGEAITTVDDHHDDQEALAVADLYALPAFTIPVEELDLCTTIQSQLFTKEKHEPFARLLLRAREITREQLSDAIDALRESHPEVVEKLALGPMPSRYSCRVCEALREFWGPPPILDETNVDFDDPVWIVWFFHEAPKSFMKRNDQLHRGRFSNMTYDRCIITYRMAGWTGDPEEPNA